MQGFNYSQLYQALQDWPLEKSTLYLANINRLIYLAELRIIRDLQIELFDVFDQVPIVQGATTVPKPSQSTPIAFTVGIAAGATSATLASAWTGASGTYVATFSDNEIQGLVLTATSTAVTWAVPMAAAVSSSAILNPLMVVERNLWAVYGGQIRMLVRRSFDYLQNYLASAPGRPLYYCDNGTAEWLIAPAADANVSAVTRHYIQRPVSLVASPNTWIGDNLGDLLFIACLMEGEQYLKADDRYADMRVKYYQELMPTASAEIQIVRRKGDYSPLEPVAGLPGPPPPSIPNPPAAQ